MVKALLDYVRLGVKTICPRLRNCQAIKIVFFTFSLQNSFVKLTLIYKL